MWDQGSVRIGTQLRLRLHLGVGLILGLRVSQDWDLVRAGPQLGLRNSPRIEAYSRIRAQSTLGLKLGLHWDHGSVWDHGSAGLRPSLRSRLSQAEARSGVTAQSASGARPRAPLSQSRPTDPVQRAHTGRGRPHHEEAHHAPEAQHLLQLRVDQPRQQPGRPSADGHGLDRLQPAKCQAQRGPQARLRRLHPGVSA